ncbi:MAG: hypothetical protein MUE88_05945 [Flavobacteriales bacterium]|jgi:DNA repair exonuclease SbcCD ATPase subunit|nr:hypothetical protein [Flavobacteriales bacterium]
MERTNTPSSSNQRRWNLAIPVLSALGILALVASLSGGDEEQATKERELTLRNERLIGEKLELEKQVARRDEALFSEQRESAFNTKRIKQLQQELDEALRAGDRARARAGEAERLKRKVADLQRAKDEAIANLENRYNAERDLQEQLERMRVERDALTARLEQQQFGSQLVNNAVVEALRGKRGHLTIRARRANEIRMGFDLPQEMAANASFKIHSPAGRSYEGGDPAMTILHEDAPHEPVAALYALSGEGPRERTARVHLKFEPKDRLVPGTYRIDICAGDVYLNTVLLNLR